MSLNEDCLLRFLSNPEELSILTEILKSDNEIFEKNFIINNFSNKINNISVKALKNNEV